MRVVFLGSAELAGIVLKSLVSHYGIASEESDTGMVMAITQPDRPRGRSLATSSCPAKQAAKAAGLRVETPENVNAPESLRILTSSRSDLIVVAAYGQILKERLLAIPPKGCVNLHASLLPKYRGAAPIQWAIANGESVTGVTTMYMNERMDAGDIILREEVAIGAEETAGDLHDKLAQTGIRVLLQTVDAIQSGNAPRVRQEEADATYAPKLKKEDGRIDWTMSARSIYNRVRGFYPWPGCFCEVPGRKGGRLKVIGSRAEPVVGDPGQVLDTQGDGPLIGTAEGAIRLIRVQPEGKRVMSGTEYVSGHVMQVGDVWR